MNTRIRLTRCIGTGLLLLLALCARDVSTSKSSDVLDVHPFLVIYPNSLIPGVPLDVRVTVLNATSSVDVTVAVWDVHAVMASNSKTMVAGETSHISVPIPVDLKDKGSQGYAVRVTGKGGLAFDTSGFIKYESKGLHIITQTDKTRYAGGQLVKFRSVILLPNLLGYKGNATTTIFDGQGNKIQVNGPQPTTGGVVEGELPLSQEPVFGDWRLVTTAQSVTVTKVFTVQRYVLPKFSVSLSKIGENDTVIEVKVQARYTFNSNVHGSCRVELYTSSSGSQLTYNKEIQGSVNFYIYKADITRTYGLYHSAVNIRASVTDTASAITMVAEKNGFVPAQIYPNYNSNDAVKVKSFDNRKTFVPGMNFYTTLMLEKDDEPVTTASKISVSVSMTTTDVKPCLLSQPSYPWLERLTRKLPTFYIDTDSSGLAPLNIPVPDNAEKILISATSELSPYGYGESFFVYPLTFYDTPMLRLVPDRPHAKVGENITISINASVEMSGKLVVEVYARGITLTVSSVDIAKTRISSVSIPVTPDMVPHCHVVVSHLTSNNDFLYDYAIVKVLGSPVKNKVTVGFNATSLAPGKGVEMTVTADPNSTVYILTEDQKNRLLGSDNDIFMYQLDDVVSTTGFEASLPGYRRQSKVEYTYIYLTSYYSLITHNDIQRSLDNTGPPVPMENNFYTTGYTFVDDGLVVLPENNNILSRVSHSEWNRRQSKYSQKLNMKYTTTTASYFPTPAPGQTYRPGVFPTFVPGMVPTPAPANRIPTMFFPTPAGLMPGGGGGAAAPEIRSFFPETWIWEKFQIGSSGKLSLPLNVPDSITSWLTSAFATNEKTGFGLAEVKPKITVKKDFFVTMEPPKVIVLGEEFLLQLTIFNYFDTMQKVLVQVNTTDNPSNVMESTFNVNPGEGHSTFFQILPKSVGPLTITALARAGFFADIAVDEIVKEVTVKPNGVHKRSNEQHLVVLTTNSFNHTVDLADPPNMVAGSKSIRMSITGDFMTNTIDGIEKLISMPYGCGEQNMMNFAPDVYITKYLKTVGKLTEKIKTRALTFMKAGLQKELSYKHYDGSFSAFGNSDSYGSSWLTAFVLKCFHQADGLIDIDDAIKTTAVHWLLRYQDSDGSFMEPGRIIHTQMQAGTGAGLKRTAFILISILENADYAKNKPLEIAVEKASYFLEGNLMHIGDMYSYAIVCHALVKAGKPLCFNRLESMAVRDGDKMSWHADTPVSHSPVTRRSTKTRAPSADIEATSYCLLTYLALGEKQKAAPIVKWLISQRNPYGGFQSTQDTIVSLQALSLYATSGLNTSHVDFNAYGGSFTHAYSVNKANVDFLHRVEVPASLTDLQITASGKGSAVIDVTMSYYVAGIENNTAIAVEGQIISESINSISVRACVQWNGVETSGMIVAELEMPTGFNYDADALSKDKVVKRHELLGQNVAMYFDGISPSRQVCPIVKMDRTDPVVKSQACHITVYDYYEPTNQARTRYESGVLKSSTICDVCPECSFCKGGGGIGVIGVGK